MKGYILYGLVLCFLCIACTGKSNEQKLEEKSEYPSFVEGSYYEDGCWVLQVRKDTVKARKELEKIIGNGAFRLEQVGNGVYSQAELEVLLEEMRRKLDATEDSALIVNVQGTGRGVHDIAIWLMVNTPEWRERFRREVMDSPAFVFEGRNDHPILCTKAGTGDTLGVRLLPEHREISHTSQDVHFFLSNTRKDEIYYGSEYWVAYERDGKWYDLPGSFAFTLELRTCYPESRDTLSASLFPEVNENRPGRYRFFKEVQIEGEDVMMMAEFGMK